jgi:hypothetical protein
MMESGEIGRNDMEDSHCPTLQGIDLKLATVATDHKSEERTE